MNKKLQKLAQQLRKLAEDAKKLDTIYTIKADVYDVVSPSIHIQRSEIEDIAPLDQWVEEKGVDGYHRYMHVEIDGVRFDVVIPVEKQP